MISRRELLLAGAAATLTPRQLLAAPPHPGSWGPVFDWPIIGIHATLAPDGSLLTFGTDKNGNQGGLMFYDVWNPATGVHKTLPNVTDVDMFCGAAAVLPSNGKILLSGGDARPFGDINFGVSSALLFNPTNDTLVKAADMEFPRWYPTAVTLPNGKVLVIGGKGGHDHNGLAASAHPELYSANGGWKTLTGIDDPILLQRSHWYYPRAWVRSDGKVVMFGAGAPAKSGIYLINTEGEGSMERIGEVLFATDTCLPAVMYAPDKVLVAAGTGDLRSIDLKTLNQPKVGDLNVNRYWANMVVLPDGTVMISGGSSSRNLLAGVSNEVTIWDPRTNSTTVGAEAAFARLYHSTTILLPDARVLSLGGGAPGPLTNLNGEIYTPGYCYNAAGGYSARPIISEAPGSINVNSVFQVKINGNVDRLTFVKHGSVTHSFNMDTRFLELPFEKSGNSYLIDPPNNPGILTPGSWMLFAISDNGTPSKAKSIKVRIT